MGLAIIIPNADFSQNNVGRVTIADHDIALTYIRAGKTSYINTNLMPSNDCTYEVKFKCIDNTTPSQFFGSRIAWDKVAGAFVSEGVANGKTRTGSLTISIPSGNIGDILTLSVSDSLVLKSGDTVIGTQTGTGTVDFSQLTDKIALYGILHDGALVDTTFRAIIYGFKVTDSSNNLIHDFNPMLGVDGIPYYLDDVTGNKHYFIGSDKIYYSVDGETEVEFQV